MAVNEFRYHGFITDIETRQGKKYPWYLVSVDDRDGNVCKFPYFGQVHHRVGDYVQLCGKLTDYKGFLNVKVASMEGAEQKGPPLPTPPGIPSQREASQEVIDDDLPF